MGHVRIGFLPHTRQWNLIVDRLSAYENDHATIAFIADATLKAVRKEYETLQYDESLIKAIKYLSNIIISTRQENQKAFLQENGFQVEKGISLFTLSNSAQTLIKTKEGSLETNKLARDAAVQAVLEYYQKHDEKQLNLFQVNENNPFNVKGSGREFCELARYFFAAFTEKKILYYIDRTASSTIDNYEQYIRFTDTLSKHSLMITEHAFGISEIMQSFAAGWFNKYALEKTPEEKNITGFLKMSLGKVREELRLEAENYV